MQRRGCECVYRVRKCYWSTFEEKGKAMRIDISEGAPRGGRDCPKCMFSMIPLRNSAVLNQDDGYLTDYGVGFDPDDHPVSSILIGDPRRYIWRHFVEPLLGRMLSKRRNRKYQRVLKIFPNTLICTHCAHLIKQR